jgi:hypothetical protein
MDAASYLPSEIGRLGYAEFSKSKDKIAVSIFYRKTMFEVVANKFYQFLAEGKKDE